MINKKMLTVYFEKSLENISQSDQKVFLQKFAYSEDIEPIFVEKESVLSTDLFERNSVLFIPNMFLLGAGLLNIKLQLENLISHGMDVVCLDEGVRFKSGENCDLLKGLELALMITKKSRSMVMKNSLSEKRKKGGKLGRVFGSKNKKPSLCEVHKDFIFQALKNGVSKSQIAKTVGVTSRTIFNFECQNGLR